MKDDTSEEEMNIQVYGPTLANYNNVVNQAMTEYWQQTKTKTWHFLKKKSFDFKTDDSKVLKRFKAESSNICFMHE